MDLKKEIIIGGISAKQKLILVKQLYAGIKAGHTMLDALNISYLHANGRLKQVLGDVIKRVGNGSYLHEAFEIYPKYFPLLFVNLIKTGEVSGSLEDNLQRLITVVSKEIEFRQKIRSAMTYPTFVLIALIGLSLSVTTFVLPNLLPLFKSISAELPVSTKILLWFSELTKSVGMMLWIYVIIIIFFIVWISHRKFTQPFFHYLSLHIPVFGSLNKNMITSQVSRTLHSLLASGLTLEKSLEISGSIITNYYYKEILIESVAFVRKGENLSKHFSKYPKYFEQIFVSLVSLGEKTGSLEDSFAYLAEFYDTEVDEKMKNLAVSLEPILLIIVGFLVGFVALAIIGPIYSLTGSLR
ncbi:type II secretion system F family protein [Candidatus Peregrinibacteria bacterium]|nr:type II secretion system F family protein [Candidatus Peregrinibacteria bacterium]